MVLSGMIASKPGVRYSVASVNIVINSVSVGIDRHSDKIDVVRLEG